MFKIVVSLLLLWAVWTRTMAGDKNHSYTL